MWGDIAIAFMLSFMTSFVCVPMTIKLAKKVGAIDYPSERRVNVKPIPRIGGIAVIIGFLVAVVFLITTMAIQGDLNLEEENMKMKLVGFLLGAIVLSSAALFDDIKNLKPWMKFLAQLVAAGIVVGFGVRIDSFNNMEIPLWASIAITMFWIVGITNAINLIDGLDGLSSGISLISCMCLLIIFATNFSPIVSIILVTALAGAITGFLPFNIHPAKTFIGDVGAQFLGYALAVIAIFGVAKTVTLFVLIAPILILGLPIFDTAFAIVRRIVKGKSIKAVFQADRGHLHHRLMDKGFTQKQAVTILYGLSATLGMSAIILIDDNWQKALAFLIVSAIVILLGYKGIKSYKKSLIEENKEQKLVDTKRLEEIEKQKEQEKAEKKKAKEAKKNK
jgi:UDP-GlcNAc:undecaprenyl-phosphate GlcNAc-1-phosphate transferase